MTYGCAAVTVCFVGQSLVRSFQKSTPKLGKPKPQTLYIPYIPLQRIKYNEVKTSSPLIPATARDLPRGLGFRASKHGRHPDCEAAGFAQFLGIGMCRSFTKL